MKATIRDVARLAGVSPSTVSRYFTGRHVVSESLSRHIDAAVRQLGYMPQEQSRRRNGLVLVMVPHHWWAFNARLLEEMLRLAPQYGLSVLVCQAHARNQVFRTLMSGLTLDGVIYLDEYLDGEIRRYIQAKGVRMVLIGAPSLDERCSAYHVNDMAAAYEGMRYLLDSGHRDIVLLSDFPHMINTGSQRIAGCQQALREAGLDVAADSLAEYGPLSSEGGWRGMDSALKKGRRFTAVFAFSDEAAAGAISRLNAAGLRVPEDVSVLGFDGIALADQLVPPLSTVAQPFEKMVSLALEECAGTAPGIRGCADHALPHRLLIRGTTRALARDTRKEEDA